MKRLHILFLLITVTCFASAQKVPSAIKKVSAKDVKAIIDSSTGPVIINFWATWCAPCIHEIPWFDSIIAAKNAPVKLLLVSLDFRSDYPKQLTEFVKKQGYKGTIVFLNETNADYFIPAIDKNWNGAIPASIFVNNSKHYYRLFNQQLPKEKFALELDKMLTGSGQ